MAKKVHEDEEKYPTSNTSAPLFISRFANSAGQGHFYSLYSAINRALSHVRPVSTIGSQLNSASFAVPIFHPSVCSQDLLLYPSHLFRLGTRKLINFLKRSPGYPVVIYDGDLVDLWLAARLATKLPKNQFIYNFHFAHRWVDDSAEELLSLISKSFASKTSNLHFFAESAKLAGRLESALGIPVRGFKVPTSLGLVNPDIGSKRDQILLVVHTSDAADWAENFVEFFTSASGGEGTQIVWLSRNITPRGHHERLRSIIGELSETDYKNLLAESKVAVMPYFWEFYRYGSSGRVEDCLLYQVAPLVPPSTAMYEDLRLRGFDPEFSEFSPKEVCARVEAYLQMPPYLPGAHLIPKLFDDLHKLRSSGPVISRRSRTVTIRDLIRWHTAARSLGGSLSRVSDIVKA